MKIPNWFKRRDARPRPPSHRLTLSIYDPAGLVLARECVHDPEFYHLRSQDLLILVKPSTIDLTAQHAAKASSYAYAYDCETIMGGEIGNYDHPFAGLKMDIVDVFPGATIRMLSVTIKMNGDRRIFEIVSGSIINK